MDKKYFILTASGAHHQVGESTVTLIYEAQNNDMVELDDGTFVKVSVVTEIMPEYEYYNQFPDKKGGSTNYGQPYSIVPISHSDIPARALSWEEIKQLPATGFTGVINSAKHLSVIEAMANGLKKAKAKLEAEGRTTKNIDSLLELARKRYAQVKTETT